MKRFLLVSSRTLDFILFFIISIPLFIVVTILIEITFFIQSLKFKKNETRNQI